MFILPKDRPKNSLEEWDIGWSRYQAYLSEIGARLPASALEYAEAPWHYNHLDHRAPHDAWLERVELVEAKNEKGSRQTNIRLVLLGAYHDGNIEMLYGDVFSYSMNCHGGNSGDWLYDEIRLSRSGNVLHEIEFENGLWLVECRSFSYQWLPAAERP